MADSDAIALLRREVEARGSIGKAAAAAGISRPSASMLLAGRYPANTEGVEARILQALGTVDCPHTGKTIGRQTCTDFANRPVPTSSPDALRHWRACQRCPHNPSTGG